MTTNVADYTERKKYQSDYAKANREAINARKREWRKRRKNEISTKIRTQESQ